MKDIGKIIVDVAEIFIGQEEVRGNKGFIDNPEVHKKLISYIESYGFKGVQIPTFDKLMIQVGWKDKQAWCAYLCELVWKMSYSIYDSKVINIIDGLFNASAVKTFTNFKRSIYFNTGLIPIPGALAVWQTYKSDEKYWTGHIAVVQESDKPFVSTIDGNSNNNGSREGYVVVEKTRREKFKPTGLSSEMVLLGYIYPEIILN